MASAAAMNQCPFMYPVRPAREGWCEGEKRAEKERVRALMTEKWFFKYTKPTCLLPRTYWLILKGAFLGVLFSTKHSKIVT